MLTGPDHLVVPHVLYDGTQDELLHQLPRHRCQADRPVISWIILPTLLIDGRHIGKLVHHIVYVTLAAGRFTFQLLHFLLPSPPPLLRQHRHCAVAALFPPPPPPSSCNIFFQFQQRSHLRWAAQTGQEHRHIKPVIPTCLCSIRHQKPQTGTAAITVVSLQSDTRPVSICLCL